MPSGARYFNKKFHAEPRMPFSSNTTAAACIVTITFHTDAVTSHIKTATIHIETMTARMHTFEPFATANEKNGGAFF